jgi:hypothetical protein
MDVIESHRHTTPTQENEGPLSCLPESHSHNEDRIQAQVYRTSKSMSILLAVD